MNPNAVLATETSLRGAIPSQSKAAVLGGGNAAWALAADLSLRGAEVRMLEFPGRRTRLAEIGRRGAIDIVRQGERKTAAISLVTQNPATALRDVDLIVVAVPAFAHRDFAELVVPHLRGDETILVFTASFGGLEFAAAAHRAGRTHRGAIVEAENLPYTCRTAGGSDVVIHVDVPTLTAAVYPARATADVAPMLTALIPGIRFGRDLLEPLLGNMNGVIHPPAILLNVPTMERARNEPWWIWEVGVTPAVARVIESLDQERLALGAKLGIGLDPVADLLWRSGYGPRGTIFETINGCAGLRSVRGPANMSHRWFVEDIPFALALWADLARCCGVPTPTMDSLCGLASALLDRDVRASGRTLASVGLQGRDAGGIMTALQDGYRPE